MKLVKARVFGLAIIFGVLSIGNAFAQSRVVVVPLGGGDFEPLQNIVTVAKQNGDFTDPNAAIASITDASASNPYLIVIGPGIYTVDPHVVMKPYVSISGSGVKETIVRGSVTGNSGDPDYADNGVILLASHTTLSNLTVENTATTTADDYIVGIMAYLVSSYTALVKNVSVVVGGTPTNSSRGIYSERSDIVIEDSYIVVDGTYRNYGLRNRVSNTAARNTIVEVTNGSSLNRGVYDSTTAASTPKFVKLDGVTVISEGAGVYITGNASTKIRHSYIEGGSNSIFVTNTSVVVNVSHSTLTGGAVSGTNYSCTFNDDGSGGTLSSTCN
ncbi:MAG: hypothetical protein AAF402_06335 [Pseudomonadota bacterium]